MISSINNSLSFKAIYERKDSNFTETQHKIIDDIKQKLNNNVNYGDYMVTSGAIKDTVELQHFIFGLKEQGAEGKKCLVYPKGSDKFIGVYDEKHSFDIKDLENNNRDDVSYESDNTWKYVGWAIIALGALFIGNGAINKFVKTPKNNNVENVLTQTKDSLNAIKKDSLNIFI